MSGAPGLLLTGGTQAPLAGLRPHRRQFRRAVLAGLRHPGAEARPVAARGRREAGMVGRSQPVLLRSATVTERGTLLTCLPDTALELDPATGRVLRSLTHPWFSDVHHARPAPSDGVYVVATGLDLVLEMEWSGRVRREWPMGSPSTWERFDRGRDFRRAPPPRPHHVHPNHVLPFRDELWVTCFHPCALVCVEGRRRGAIVPLATCGVHDGHVEGSTAWCTAVEGRIVAVDLERLEVRAEHDLLAFGGVEAKVGWFRGVQPLGDGTFLVGVSRLRRTRLHENLVWLRHREWDRPRYRHSVLLHVRPETRTVLREIDLRPAGLDAVYSVVSVGGAPA
ncbi:MAG: hypothetical protein Q8W51_00165 [Candidatus Palauibacterales bacterium]|nr:hypothetical protein [Candidatus Palauibacterales bacterium]MDP2582506.1 hypothetical protein [Candidatus Palauibacterales bacterium]